MKRRMMPGEIVVTKTEQSIETIFSMIVCDLIWLPRFDKRVAWDFGPFLVIACDNDQAAQTTLVIHADYIGWLILAGTIED